MSTIRPACLLAVATCVLMAAWLQAGCTAPGHQQEVSGALTKLSLDEQQLVRSGRIRTGFTKEAVQAAWGSPTTILPGSPTAGPFECWVYSHTFYGEGGGYYGVRKGLVYVPPEHRYRYDTNDFYETPIHLRGFCTVSTEVPYKKAYFDGNLVVAFGTADGDDAVVRGLPGPSHRSLPPHP